MQMFSQSVTSTLQRTSESAAYHVELPRTHRRCMLWELLLNVRMMLRMRMEVWLSIAGNSFSILLLPEPTQSTWQQLNHVMSIVLPTPCRRFWENIEMRTYTAADVKCIMIQNQQNLDILGEPIFVCVTCDISYIPPSGPTNNALWTSAQFLGCADVTPLGVFNNHTIEYYNIIW